MLMAPDSLLVAIYDLIMLVTPDQQIAVTVVKQHEIEQKPVARKSRTHKGCGKKLLSCLLPGRKKKLLVLKVKKIRLNMFL